MSRLRILFLLRRIGPYHHARFAALAANVDLVTAETRPQSREYPWVFSTDAPYKRITFPTMADVESGMRGKPLREYLGKILDEHSPDTVVTTGWADGEYHAAVLECSARKIPVVVVSDNRYQAKPRKFYLEWIKRLIVRGFDAALVAGKMSTDYMIGLGFSRERIFQPWDVVDNSYFAKTPGAFPFGERNFLCVSRFIPEKNIPRFIEGFAIYIAGGGKRRLIMLGSGGGEGALRAQLRQHQLEDKVDLMGFVQYDGLPGYFAKSLCLILPSISDQWGLVVNEAMAAGLPVLVSDLCGCSVDLVQPGKNGYTFDPTDPAVIAGRLTDMESKNEAQWTAMCHASREIIKDWDLDSFATGTEKACRHAIQHPGFRIFAPVHLLLSR